MTPREANVLLTEVALLERRPVATSGQEAAAQANAWASVLADVSLDAALAAARAHFREEERRLMPADVIRRVGGAPGRLTEEQVARAAWLDARGLTEEQVAAMSRAEVEALLRAEGVPGV